MAGSFFTFDSFTRSQAKLQAAVDSWVASKGDPKKEKAVHAILNKAAYKAQPYLVRNAPFVTSTKLLALENDPYLCWLQYVKCEPPPIQYDSEALTLGIAVDDLVTSGEDAFRSRYIAVPRRDKKAEEGNPGKVLLTSGQMETVTNAAEEFASRHFFPKQLRKKNLLAIAHGLPLKAELDGYEEADKIVRDLKTTASLNTFIDDFIPGRRFYEKYLFQLAFYSYVHEVGIGERVSHSELLVCDKYEWCRSHLWQISYPTLRAQFPRVERLLQDWNTYQSAGIWPMLLRLDTLEGLKKFNDSPYYPMLQQFKASIQPTNL